jgi:hypothetical protein
MKKLKDTFYFSHDYNARNDPKLIKLLMKLGQEGKGVYWDLIEMLYEQDGYLKLNECESYAFALHTHCDLLNSVIRDFDLFTVNNTVFYSESVLKRLEKRRIISEKAVISANKRWKNANAMPTHSEGNARKGKERKGKENKINNNTDIIFPEKLNNEVFKKAFGEWVNYRKEIKHKLTNSTINKQLKFLEKQPFPIECITQSIQNGWQGLFELKQSDMKNTTPAEIPKPKFNYEKYALELFNKNKSALKKKYEINGTLDELEEADKIFKKDPDAILKRKKFPVVWDALIRQIESIKL